MWRFRAHDFESEGCPGSAHVILKERGVHILDGVTECVIEFERRSDYAGVTAASGTALKSKILKLAQQFPDSVEIISRNEDGSLFAHVPVKWVKVSAPRRVEMSEERKAAASERLREYRAKQKAEKENAEFSQHMNAPE